MDYCCDKFKENAEVAKPMVGVIGVNPQEVNPTSQFERQDNGKWAINGCCGGGCYVVDEINFCPFCGTKL